MIAGHIHRDGARHIVEHFLGDLGVLRCSHQQRIGRRSDAVRRRGGEYVREGLRQPEALSDLRRLVRGSDVAPGADAAHDAAAAQEPLAALDGARRYDDDGT